MANGIERGNCESENGRGGMKVRGGRKERIEKRKNTQKNERDISGRNKGMHQ